MQQMQSTTTTHGNKAATTHDAIHATKTATPGNKQLQRMMRQMQPKRNTREQSSHNARHNKCNQNSNTRDRAATMHEATMQPKTATTRDATNAIKNSNTREQSSYNA